MGRDDEADAGPVRFESKSTHEEVISMYIDEHAPGPGADEALANRLSALEADGEALDPLDQFDYIHGVDDLVLAPPLREGLDDLHRHHEDETEPQEMSARSMTVEIEPTNWTIRCDALEEVAVVRWYPGLGRMDLSGPRSFYRSWHDLRSYSAGLDIVVPVATQVLAETARILQAQETIDHLANGD